MRRLVDVLVSALALALSAPLLALAMAAIRLESPGSVIYRQRRRLEVKPGITGWAQVNGRTTLPWHERIELDIWYVDNRSLLLDLRILLRSAKLVFEGYGLYKGETGGWKGPTGEQP